jgi:hypothetical protein
MNQGKEQVKEKRPKEFTTNFSTEFEKNTSPKVTMPAGTVQ